MKLRTELYRFSNYLKRYKESYLLATTANKLVNEYMEHEGLDVKDLTRKTVRDELDNLVDKIVNVYGIDIRSRSKKRENVFMRAIYYKVATETVMAKNGEIADAVDRTHGCVWQTLTNGLFEDAMRSPYHRNAYYELIGVEDPDVVHKRNGTVSVSVQFLIRLTKDYQIFLSYEDMKRLKELIKQ